MGNITVESPTYLEIAEERVHEEVDHDKGREDSIEDPHENEAALEPGSRQAVVSVDLMVTGQMERTLPRGLSAASPSQTPFVPDLFGRKDTP